MELILENRPETCAMVGLECGACVRHAAASVASICGGLEPLGAQQLFFQMYPSAGCRPMAHAFVLAYNDATPREPRVLTFVTAAA